jgi:DnaJ-class molecular chaperone
MSENAYKAMIAKQIQDGLLDDVLPKKCWDCKGTGKVRFVNGGTWGNEAGWMRCPTCKGKRTLVVSDKEQQ